MADYCPLIKGKCKEHACKFFIHLLGNSPQSDKAMDHWDCAVSWLPILLIEGSQQTRHAASAIESFRNETVKLALETKNLALPKLVNNN
jgi:hypothetical protein